MILKVDAYVQTDVVVEVGLHEFCAICRKDNVRKTLSTAHVFTMYRNKKIEAHMTQSVAAYFSLVIS